MLKRSISRTCASHIHKLAKTTPTKRCFTITQPEIDENTMRLGDRLLNGDRGALSKAITLVESKLYNHHLAAQQLLFYIASKKKVKETDSFRIGVSGPPGVGK